MADEPTTPEGGDSTPEPDPPTAVERFALDEEARSALPEEQQGFSVPDIQSIAEAAAAIAVTAERERSATEATQRAETEAAAVTSRAAAQSDIDYATSLDERRNSTDPEVSVPARAEWEQNRERYERGLGMKYTQKDADVRKTIIDEHYAPLLADLQQNDLGAFGSWFSEHGREYGGNTLRSAIEYGKTLSADAALKTGKDEGARDERIRLGTETAPPPEGEVRVTQGNYGDATWVMAQAARDPDWLANMSPDGKKTNMERADAAGLVAKAREAMRSG